MMIDRLANTDFSRVVFSLEFQEPFILRREMVLRLRREFQRVVRIAEREGLEYSSQLRELLDPAVPADPFARRVHQKPAPTYVLQPPEQESMTLDAGDVFPLEVIFVGDPGRKVVLFRLILNLLGRFGFCMGEGCFELTNVVGLDSAGNRVEITSSGDPESPPAVPRTSLSWWVEEQLPYDQDLELVFVTPARLLSKGKPLFDASFSSVFPFMLRRVTSMMSTWCGLELVDDPNQLLNASACVVSDSGLHWVDWRSLQGDGDDQDIGGVTGSARLDRTLPEELLVVAALGSLFNIGRSAAYGNGHFKLVPQI